MADNAPTVKLLANPNKTDILVGTKQIALSAQASGAGLKFAWKHIGIGELKGDITDPMIFYVPPKEISEEVEQAIVSITVTDKNGQVTTDSITFIVSKTIPTPSVDEKKDEKPPSSVRIIEIDGKKNCAGEEMDGTAKRDAIQVDLSPGKYKVAIVEGAVSQWATDREATEKGKNPWICFIMVFAENKLYELGKRDKYLTPSLAFENNANSEIQFELTQSAPVYFWINDFSEQYGIGCYNNRGSIKLSIQKF